MAANEVQWVLCFQLACTVQQLQRKYKKQQQPVVQLLSALGLPAGFDSSRCARLADDEHGHLVLLAALHNQLEAATDKHKMKMMQGVQVGRTATAEPAGTVADTCPATDQQLERSSCKASKEVAQGAVDVVMPPQLLQPLVLTLVQLCTQGQPSLQLLRDCCRHCMRCWQAAPPPCRRHRKRHCLQQDGYST
jgi:hypothetical protein